MLSFQLSDVRLIVIHATPRFHSLKGDVNA